MAGGSTRYEPLDIDEGGVQYRRPPPPQSVFLAPRTWADWVFVAANAGLFIVTALFWLSGSKGVPSEVECAKATSSYSPVLSSLDFWEGNFENGFMRESIYRGPPTRDLEQAWDDLWHHQGVGVSKQGLVALNKTQGKYLQTNRSTAAEPEYYALVEMFHQLHCLNIIRQATWPIRVYNASWGEALQPMNVSESLGRAHVDHCVETLRLSLMCLGDVTPMLLRTEDGTLNTSAADFDVHHKCRSYEQIRDFVDASGVDPIA
ncbi:tat pathway signal sequence [Cordyceps militaris]|uniref:Tat pathway signal sequence n=1 Tax=Cordyceps militaris TaxID=73501 RepID=A0A2H4SW09_CORMI|nr:tat pathway signal sequence [Cordyceps militaris]